MTTKGCFDVLSAAITRGFCEQTQVIALGDSSWSIATPFYYGDGDGFPIIVERASSQWRITDRGLTLDRWFLDHENYPLDQNRLEVVRRLVESYGLSMIENEIIFNWPEQDPPDANAIAYFVRAVASVDAIPRLRAEREQPFASKLRRHIEDWVPKRYLTPNWRAPQDSRQLYPVDMRFDVGDNVQLAFFIGNTNKASLTFGILKQLRDWDVSGQWLLAYSRLSNISRDALSRLIDASGDQASLVAIDPDDEARLKSMLTQRGVPVLSAS